MTALPVSPFRPTGASGKPGPPRQPPISCAQHAAWAVLILLVVGGFVSCDSAAVSPVPGGIAPPRTPSAHIPPTPAPPPLGGPALPSPFPASPSLPPPAVPPTGAPVPSATAPPTPGRGGPESLPAWATATVRLIAPPGTPSPPAPAAAPPTTPTITDIPLPGDTSRFDYQSLDPQSGLLFIAHLGASQVLVFDTRAARVMATIPDVAGVHGLLAIPALGRVYASATGDNQVALIDEQRLQVTARIPGGEYPDGLAYDPHTRRVFVSDETGGTDTVIDTTTNTRVATVPLGGEAGNTQYDAVSGRMWVAVQTRNQLVAIDPGRARVVTRYDLPGCDHAHGLFIEAARRRAFVACDGNARLLTVDLASGQVQDTQPVGDTPDVLAFDPAWQRLYVAAESGVLTIFDVSRLPLRTLYRGMFAAGAHSVAVDPASHRVYFPLADSGGRPVLRVLQYATP